jgi:hypothetical protein
MTFVLTLKHQICLPTFTGMSPEWSAISINNYRDQETIGSLERNM